MTNAWEEDPGVARLLGAAAMAGPRFRLVVLAKVLEPLAPLGSASNTALARAEYGRAERLQGEAVELLEQIGHPAVHGVSVSFRIWLGHHVGHSDRILDPEVWDFGTDPRWTLGARLFPAFVLVDCGRTGEAAVLYQRCGARQGWDLARLGVLPVWSIAARVAAPSGCRG